VSARHLVSDSLVLARRQLEHVRQLPEKLLDVTLQPIMFTVLFAFVFGKVIAVDGGSYREYLLGGILVQTIGFGIMGPAVSIANDLREGVVDRMRTLPMARAAYLIGHVIAELGATAIAITIISLSGLIIGWGIYSDVPHAIAGYGIVLLFAFAMIWCGTLLGMTVRTPDAAQGIVFMTVFPLTFLATTFVPINGYEGVLHTVAAYNPISALAAAVRTLFGNPTATPPDAPWPLLHPVTVSLVWSIGIILISVPTTIRMFRVRTEN
jgi:ABC transporter DrrB family efflux protein